MTDKIQSTTPAQPAPQRQRYVAELSLNKRYVWCIVDAIPRVENVIEQFGCGPDAQKAAQARLEALATQPPAAPGETEPVKTCNYYMQRAYDAEADALRLHREKMEMYERAIAAEAKLASHPSSSAESGERDKPSPWDLVAYQKLRAMPSSLNDAIRTMDGAAGEIDRLYVVLEELAVGFESARDRCAYAAEAQRLDNCAKFCRSHALPVVTSAQPQPAPDIVAGMKKAMEIVGEMRMSEAGIFDEKHSGQRGEDRSNALYDAYVAIRALAAQPPAAPVDPKSASAAVRESVDSTPRPPASAAMGHSAEADTQCSAGSEPAAWSYELAHAFGTRGYSDWQKHITETKPNVPEASIRNLRPLYLNEPQGVVKGLLSSDNPYDRHTHIEKWLDWDTAWHKLALLVSRHKQPHGVCRCSPLTRYADAPHEPPCPLSRPQSETPNHCGRNGGNCQCTSTEECITPSASR